MKYELSKAHFLYVIDELRCCSRSASGSTSTLPDRVEVDPDPVDVDEPAALLDELLLELRELHQLHELLELLELLELRLTGQRRMSCAFAGRSS